MIKSKAASYSAATLDTNAKNKALEEMSKAILAEEELILRANQNDLKNAVEKGNLSDVLLDRLRLNHDRIQMMAEGLQKVKELDDPVGKILSEIKRPNGLIIQKVSVPFGVVAIIYESRPNVTSDAAALAIKSGNSCILRCGKEAHTSALAITDALRSGLKSAGLDPDLVLLVDDLSRTGAEELMNGKGYVDLLIPRGGASLIRACVENATVPCIETGTGICHIYVDCDADIEMAVNIVKNAKISRPSVCNAAEVCLVHEKIAPIFLPKLEEALVTHQVEEGEIPVTIRADHRSKLYGKSFQDASPTDFDTEFLDYILAVKTVCSVQEAARHIDMHSTGHSEAIVTNNAKTAHYFTTAVDSAAVYVNASTRFTDGGEFGFGCEMGISTQKLHVRGPMGLNELTTYKYIIIGHGNVRS
jgi:glutamate-5-semialdehyde dehydrogenase